MAEADQAKPPGNWIKPKTAHKRMVNGFLQVGVNLIFCLRAQEKIDLSEKDRNGKIVIKSAGWQPICEKRFPYEMTASFTLNPLAPGVVDMGLPHKIQDQHRSAFPPGQHISVEAGRMLGAWARGQSIETPDKALWDKARRAANEGMDALRAFSGDLLKSDRAKLKPIREELIATGNRADQNLGSGLDGRVHDEVAGPSGSALTPRPPETWPERIDGLRRRIYSLAGEPDGREQYERILETYGIKDLDRTKDETKLAAVFNALTERASWSARSARTKSNKLRQSISRIRSKRRRPTLGRGLRKPGKHPGEPETARGTERMKGRKERRIVLPTSRSSDPHFASKRRPCGRCGRVFRTTPQRRYHCGPCRTEIRRGHMQAEGLW